MTATARTIRWLAALLGVLALLASPSLRSVRAAEPAPATTAAPTRDAFARPGASPKAVVNPGSLSGLWYDPLQSGQGFSFSFSESGAVAVTWYVYSQTQQIWLVGSASLVDNGASIPVFISSGANFPPAFDPGAVTLTPWGRIFVTIRNCSSINVAWDSDQPGFSDGFVDVVPLIVAGGLSCQVTNADDHGGSCGEASNAPLDGTVGGRIEPQDDQDFFRVVVPSNGVLKASSRGGGPDFDPVGTLYDQNCEELTEDDDSDGRNFLLSRGVTPSTYFVRIRSLNAESLGDYQIDFSFDAMAPGSDDYPDDCATAPTAPLNGTLSGRIDPANDRDVFRYVLTEPGILQVTSSRPNDDLDPVGALLDQNCNELTENDDNDETRNFLVGALLPPGTYYVRVRSYEEASVGAYSITSTFSTTNVADDHGDDCGDATLVQPTSTTPGAIDPRFDVDVFRFEIPDYGMFLVDATRLGDPPTADPLVQLLDASCEQLIEDDDGGPGQNPRLGLTLNPGTYYLRVRTYNDDTAGPYSLALRYIPQVPGPDEHGDSCATATQLGQYGSGAGRIDPESDVDYFRIDAEFMAELTVYSYGVETLDPIGAILDANCQVIVENDDSDGGNFSLAAPASPGPYFLRVGSSNGATRGDYSFDYYYVSTARAKHAPPAPRARAKPAPKGSGDAPILALDSARHARGFDGDAKRVPTARPKAVTNPASLTGLWYDPARSGQGFSFSFNQAGTVAATWYVYNGGRQIWLVGSGQLQGNRVVMPTVITNGALFPPAFQSDAVMRTDWGTLTLDVRSCSRIDVTWNSVVPGYGTGTLTVEPLIVAGGLPCEVSSDVDDHGNTCAAATAVATNAARAGRVDPAQDEDYFRLTVGSAGTLTVQSSATTSLNPAGRLLDGNCAVLAENDNAAGREFAITRSVTPGTYHVRVGSSNAASVGDYSVANAFSANTASTGVTLSLRNDLLYDVDFRANGGAPIRVAAGATATRTVTITGPLSVTFTLVGAVNEAQQPVGDLQGGVFDPVSSPSGTIQYTIDNRIGDEIYFAPSITNSTAGSLLIGVNMGTPDENRCNCIVAPQAKDVLVGYYRLLANSNVRGYNSASSYSGPFTSLPAQGLPVPLSGFVEASTGRVIVNFKRPPQ